jgi:alpha-L-arabinofuranosidase
LAGPSLADENSLQEPTKIAPVSMPLTDAATHFTYEFQPWSMTVLRVKVKS